MRFADGFSATAPSAPMSGESSRRSSSPSRATTCATAPTCYPKGPYPHIQAASGRAEAMMWAVERPDGGRGFGFTGGHFHDNWGNDDFRKTVLNALVWVAKGEVPAGGIGVETSPRPTSTRISIRSRRRSKRASCGYGARCFMRNSTISCGLEPLGIVVDHALVYRACPSCSWNAGRNSGGGFQPRPRVGRDPPARRNVRTRADHPWSGNVDQRCGFIKLYPGSAASGIPRALGP